MLSYIDAQIIYFDELLKNFDEYDSDLFEFNSNFICQTIERIRIFKNEIIEQIKKMDQQEQSTELNKISKLNINDKNKTINNDQNFNKNFNRKFDKGFDLDFDQDFDQGFDQNFNKNFNQNFDKSLTIFNDEELYLCETENEIKSKVKYLESQFIMLFDCRKIKIINESQKLQINNFYTFAKKRETILRKIQCYNTVNDLIKLSEKSPKQGSNEWKKIRWMSITASNSATAIGENEDLNSVVDYITDMANFHSSFTGNIMTQFGTKYEPLGSAIYIYDLNHNNNKDNNKLVNIENKIKEKYTFNEAGFICSSNPLCKCIGASPDGLIQYTKEIEGNIIEKNGYIIEIKFPYNRWPNGNIPHYYWFQIQLQLEVCNLEVCYFLDFKILEYLSFENFKNKNNNYFYKGAVVDYYDKNCDDRGLKYNENGINKDNVELKDLGIKNENKHIFSTPEMSNISDDELQKWAIFEMNKLVMNGYSSENISIKYWLLVRKHYVRVDRDYRWFYNNYYKYNGVWDIIKSCREDKTKIKNISENLRKIGIIAHKKKENRKVEAKQDIKRDIKQNIELNNNIGVGSSDDFIIKK